MYRADETGLIDEQELDSSLASMSNAQYRQEWLCDFSAASDNVLITIDVVSAATRKSYHPSKRSRAPRKPSALISRALAMIAASSKSARGSYAFDPIVMRVLDNMEVVGRLVAQINEFEPEAVFIDAGRGEGVIDRVRQLGHTVIEVNFGGKASDPVAYVNKRAEMWDDMAKWFAAGGRIPNHTDLIKDLCVPTYKYDAANRFQLESKDDIKKRRPQSPDIADALALTFAFPVYPAGRRRHQPRFAAMEYDVYR